MFDCPPLSPFGLLIERYTTIPRRSRFVMVLIRIFIELYNDSKNLLYLPGVHDLMGSAVVTFQKYNDISGTIQIRLEAVTNMSEI